jgi:allantoicase
LKYYAKLGKFLKIEMSIGSSTHLPDLAGERVGGCVLVASDEFFAEKENLIKAADPAFIADRYTERGKWMDGWETRRRRVPGHDWALLRLGIPGVIHGVVVDTRFFTGNYPEQMSLEACTASPDAGTEELTDWIEIIPQSSLRGDTLHNFEVSHRQRFTHVRLNIFPDGGVARLRVYGEASSDWQRFGREINLAAAEYGARIADSTDRHYGHPENLILPGPGRSMADGWETRRRRGPGHDWVTLRLAVEGFVDRVEVDTLHFKGNYPEACSLEVSLTGEEGSWTEVLGQCKLQANTQQAFEQQITAAPPARFARFHIYPDGGVSRLRLFGRMTETGRLEANLAALNAAPAKQALADFLRCCGSPAWAGAMAARRPHPSLLALEKAAESAWSRCSPEDWREAFSAHPAIGQQTGGAWSRVEQSGAAEASAETLRQLEELNIRYREKFGYTFIVCATGRTANEMLDMLRSRIENDAGSEIQNAAREQRLITRLRLRKLLSA